MKFRFLPLFFVFVFLLSACVKATPESTDVSSQIFTAVAQTLTAQYTPVAATTEAPPTETPTPAPTATIAAPSTPTTGVVYATTAGCDNSLYVSDVTIPDGTTLAAGSTFTKTWSIKNTGTCSWTSTYQIKFASGSQLGGASTAIGSAVAPGNSINVSVSMTAPSTSGTYTGYWRLVNDSSTFFGGYVTVNIKVGSTLSSTTGTPTVVGTLTETATPTSTSESTVPTTVSVPTQIPTAAH
jgi:hypothetical protein